MSEIAGADICPTAMLLGKVSPERGPLARAVVSQCIGCTAIGRRRTSPEDGQLCPSLAEGVAVLAQDAAEHPGTVIPAIQAGRLLPDGPLHTALRTMITDREAKEAAEAPNGKEWLRQQLVTRWEMESREPRQTVWDRFMPLIQEAPGKYTISNARGTEGIWDFSRMLHEGGRDIEIFTTVRGSVDYERMPPDLQAAIKYITPSQSGKYPKAERAVIKSETGLLGIRSQGRWGARKIPRELVHRRLDEVVPLVLRKVEGSVTARFVGEEGAGRTLLGFAATNPGLLVAETEVTDLREPFFTTLMERCRRGTFVPDENGTRNIVAAEPTEEALLVLLRQEKNWGLGEAFTELQDARDLLLGSLPVGERVR